MLHTNTHAQHDIQPCPYHCAHLPPTHPCTAHTLPPTCAGFRRIGFGRLISFLAVPFIHGSFSYPTVKGWLPDPFMRIFMENMHRTKHGSDSGE